MLLMFQFDYLDFTYSPVMSAVKLAAVFVLWVLHVGMKFLAAFAADSK